jgi:uncharacterized protein YbjT (DUF2867 family)
MLGLDRRQTVEAAMSRILVLGGTGMLGTPTVRHLVADGFDVRLFARNPVKARERFGRSVDVVAGHVGHLKTLERAMEGCDAVHVSVGGEADLSSATDVTAMAPRLGVRRVGYVSGTTVCEENAWYPMVAAKLAAETALRACGVPWTIFRPTWPMEQLWNFVRTGRPMVIGHLKTPYHFFAADDMGRMVAAAYRLEAAAGQCFHIHGPEAMTLKEAVERYARALDPDAGEAAVMSVRQARIVSFLKRNRRLRGAADLMSYFERVGEPGDPSAANRLLGAPTTTLDEWVVTEGRVLAEA